MAYVCPANSSAYNAGAPSIWAAGAFGMHWGKPTHKVRDTWVYQAWQKERVGKPSPIRYLCGSQAIGSLSEARFSAIVTPAIRRRLHESVWFRLFLEQGRLSTRVIRK